MKRSHPAAHECATPRGNLAAALWEHTIEDEDDLKRCVDDACNEALAHDLMLGRGTRAPAEAHSFPSRDIGSQARIEPKTASRSHIAGDPAHGRPPSGQPPRDEINGRKRPSDHQRRLPAEEQADNAGPSTPLSCGKEAALTTRPTLRVFSRLRTVGSHLSLFRAGLAHQPPCGKTDGEPHGQAGNPVNQPRGPVRLHRHGRYGPKDRPDHRQDSANQQRRHGDPRRQSLPVELDQRHGPERRDQQQVISDDSPDLGGAQRLREQTAVRQPKGASGRFAPCVHPSVATIRNRVAVIASTTG